MPASRFAAWPVFSNPRQEYEGEPLGVLHTGAAESGVTGPADAAAVLNATGPAVALWRDRPAGLNLPPTAAGTLPDRTPTLDATLDVDLSQAFADPDGDALSYAVSSSAPRVVSVFAAGARVTLTAAAEGTATIRLTASDRGGLTATQTFTVTVGGASTPFTDPEIRAGGDAGALGHGGVRLRQQRRGAVDQSALGQPGQPVSLSLAAYQPGSLDCHGPPWTGIVAWS